LATPSPQNLAVERTELVPLLFAAAAQQSVTGDVAQALAQMNESGHPDAARLARSVASVTGLRLAVLQVGMQAQ
jgi:hypothetical protein